MNIGKGKMVNISCWKLLVLSFLYAVVNWFALIISSYGVGVGEFAMIYGLFFYIAFMAIILIIVIHKITKNQSEAVVPTDLLMYLLAFNVLMLLFNYSSCQNDYSFFFIQFLFNKAICDYNNLSLINGSWIVFISTFLKVLYVTVLFLIAYYAYKIKKITSDNFDEINYLASRRKIMRLVGIVIVAYVSIFVVIKIILIPSSKNLILSSQIKTQNDLLSLKLPTVEDFIFLRVEGSERRDTAQIQSIIVFKRDNNGTEKMLKKISFPAMYKPHAFFANDGKAIVYEKDQYWYKVFIEEKSEGIKISEDERELLSQISLNKNLQSPDKRNIAREDSHNTSKRPYLFSESNTVWLDNNNVLIAELDNESGSRLYTREFKSGKEKTILRGLNGAGFYNPIPLSHDRFLVGIWIDSEGAPAIIDNQGKTLLSSESTFPYTGVVFGERRGVYEIQFSGEEVTLKLISLRIDYPSTQGGHLSADRTKLISYQNKNGNLEINVIDLKNSFKEYTQKLMLPGIFLNYTPWFMPQSER